jgi:hypothetical protein
LWQFQNSYVYNYAEMNARTCRLCGKPLSRIWVGGGGEFCSREHRNQFRLRCGMDRLMEAGKVATLMRRRETPKALAFAVRLDDSADPRRGFFRMEASPGAELRLRPVPFRVGVVSVPTRDRSKRAMLPKPATPAHPAQRSSPGQPVRPVSTALRLPGRDVKSPGSFAAAPPVTRLQAKAGASQAAHRHDLSQGILRDLAARSRMLALPRIDQSRGALGVEAVPLALSSLQGKPLRVSCVTGFRRPQMQMKSSGAALAARSCLAETALTALTSAAVRIRNGRTRKPAAAAPQVTVSAEAAFPKWTAPPIEVPGLVWPAAKRSPLACAQDLEQSVPKRWGPQWSGKPEPVQLRFNATPRFPGTRLALLSRAPAGAAPRARRLGLAPFSSQESMLGARAQSAIARPEDDRRKTGNNAGERRPAVSLRSS